MDSKLKQVHGQIIGQVAQYVFDHSDQPISLDQLARYTGFSKYHFNRIFFAATGFQLGEYIQRQKLEKAMHLLKRGQGNILEVALSVGYESASSFTRAFKTNFGCTPTAIMNGDVAIDNASFINDRAGVLAPKKRLSETGLEPVWKTLEGTRVIGLYGRGFEQQSFSQVAGQLFQRLSEIAAPLNFDQLQPIGVAIDNPWVGEQAETSYFAGFLSGLDPVADELEHYDWQAGRWACFMHQGPHSTMWQTISQVYAQWVLPNQIKLKDQHIIQRYINSPQVVAADELLTELYFAVADQR